MRITIDIADATSLHEKAALIRGVARQVQEGWGQGTVRAGSRTPPSAVWAVDYVETEAS